MEIWTKYSINDESVFLKSSEDLSNKVSSKLMPFFSCEKNYDPRENCWRIVLDEFSNAVINPTQMGMSAKAEAREPLREIYIDGESKEICIKKPLELEWRVQIIIRYIRDLLRNLHRQNSNCLFLHAGLATYKGKGICILGDKMAGKTSTIFNILSSGEGSFISNDDLTLKLGISIEGIGWPRAISIRPDTFYAINGLRERFLKISNELEHPSKHKFGSADSIFIYPQELSNLLDFEILPYYRTDILLFSSFTQELPSIQKINSLEAAKLLEKNILTDINRHARQLDDYFPDLSQSTDITKKINKVVQNVDSYIIKQNFEDLNSSLILLDKVLTNI